VAPDTVAIVLVDRPDAAAQPLMRAILAALGIDSASIRVAGTSLPAGARVLLSMGADHPEAAVAAPPLPALARDAMAKRALWRSLRPLLRRA
jgi:DNA polymerase III psi subunit